MLFLNSFLAEFDNFTLKYLEGRISKDLGLEKGQFDRLQKYWIGLVYAIGSILVAWFADYAKCRAGALALVSGLGGVCLVGLGLVTSFGPFMVGRIWMSIFHAGIEALSISLISDMIPWPDVFVGISVFYASRYLTQATAGRIALIFEVLGVKKWGDRAKCTGIVGIIFAVIVALVIPEPDRQKSLLADSIQGFGFYREKDKDKNAISGWKDVKDTCMQMMGLKSLWILVLSTGVKLLGTDLFNAHIADSLQSVSQDRINLTNTYGLIYGAAGSASIIFGGITALVIWRTTTCWRWKAVPFWISAVGGVASNIFLICALFSRTNRSEATTLTIIYSNIAATLFASETWLGVLSTIMVSLLSPSCKTLGFAVCSAIQWVIYAAGPEALRLGLGAKDPSGASYAQIIKVAISIIIPLCHLWAGVGILLGIRLVRHDMEVPEVLGNLSYGRRLRFVFAAVISASIVIVLMAFGVKDMS